MGESHSVRQRCRRETHPAIERNSQRGTGVRRGTSKKNRLALQSRFVRRQKKKKTTTQNAKKKKKKKRPPFIKIRRESVNHYANKSRKKLRRV